jgi:hypothetical protein
MNAIFLQWIYECSSSVCDSDKHNLNYICDEFIKMTNEQTTNERHFLQWIYECSSFVCDSLVHVEYEWHSPSSELLVVVTHAIFVGVCHRASMVYSVHYLSSNRECFTWCWALTNWSRAGLFLDVAVQLGAQLTCWRKSRAALYLPLALKPHRPVFQPQKSLSSYLLIVFWLWKTILMPTNQKYAVRSKFLY